jgi:hypothetical protein
VKVPVKNKMSRSPINFEMTCSADVLPYMINQQFTVLFDGFCQMWAKYSPHPQDCCQPAMPSTQRMWALPVRAGHRVIPGEDCYIVSHLHRRRGRGEGVDADYSAAPDRSRSATNPEPALSGNELQNTSSQGTGAESAFSHCHGRLHGTTTRKTKAYNAGF